MCYTMRGSKDIDEGQLWNGNDKEIEKEKGWYPMSVGLWQVTYSGHESGQAINRVSRGAHVQ